MIGSSSSRQLLVVILSLVALGRCNAFVQQQRGGQCLVSSSSSTTRPTCLSSGGRKGDNDNSSEEKKGIFAGLSNFLEEFDAFLDDASARRLGAGASFYGKRKSSFYGKDDKMKKANKNEFDGEEDYQGPTSTGLFQWMQDENGQMRPVTRGKQKILDKFDLQRSKDEED